MSRINVADKTSHVNSNHWDWDSFTIPQNAVNAHIVGSFSVQSGGDLTVSVYDCSNFSRDTVDSRDFDATESCTIISGETAQSYSFDWSLPRKTVFALVEDNTTNHSIKYSINADLIYDTGAGTVRTTNVGTTTQVSQWKFAFDSL